VGYKYCCCIRGDGGVGCQLVNWVVHWWRGWSRSHLLVKGSVELSQSRGLVHLALMSSSQSVGIGESNLVSGSLFLTLSISAVEGMSIDQ